VNKSEGNRPNLVIYLHLCVARFVLRAILIVPLGWRGGRVGVTHRAPFGPSGKVRTSWSGTSGCLFPILSGVVGAAAVVLATILFVQRPPGILNWSFLRFSRPSNSTASRSLPAASNWPSGGLIRRAARRWKRPASTQTRWCGGSRSKDWTTWALDADYGERSSFYARGLSAERSGPRSTT
jgi:hypothetical protein